MSQSKELMYTGDIIDAVEAERIGLVICTVSDDELLDRTTDLARKLASGPSVAHELTKRLAYSSQTRTLEDQLWLEGQASQATATTEDKSEGIRAFLEKRGPVFQER